jgi:hypothetical protein
MRIRDATQALADFVRLSINLITAYAAKAHNMGSSGIRSRVPPQNAIAIKVVPLRNVMLKWKMAF